MNIKNTNKKFKLILISSILILITTSLIFFYYTSFNKKLYLYSDTNKFIKNNYNIGILNKSLINNETNKFFNHNCYSQDYVLKGADYKVLESLEKRHYLHVEDILIESYLYNVLNKLLKSALDIHYKNISIRANRYYCGEDQTPIFDISLVQGMEINAFFFGYNHIRILPEILKISPFNEHGFFVVLGHELSHCLCGHAEELLKIIFSTKTNPMTMKQIISLIALRDSELSRRNEYEADKYGLIMTSKCGLSPKKSIDSFIIEKIYLTDESKLLHNKFESLLTHPTSSKRVSRFRDLYTQLPDTGYSRNSLDFELFNTRINTVFYKDFNFSNKTHFYDDDDSVGVNLKTANDYNNALFLKNSGNYQQALDLLLSNKKLSKHPWGKFLRLELLVLLKQKLIYSEVEDMGMEFQKYAGEVFKYRTMAKIMSLSKDYDKAIKLLEAIDCRKRSRFVYKEMKMLYNILNKNEKAIAADIEFSICNGDFNRAKELLNYLAKISKDPGMDEYQHARTKFVNEMLNWKID